MAISTENIIRPLPFSGADFYITQNADILLYHLYALTPSFFFMQINNDTVFTDCYRAETKHYILWSGVWASQ